ncbi:MAG: IclR family transcriptional regulator [Chloroflexota bacterium]
MPKQNPNSPQSVFGKIAAILDLFTVEQPILTLAEITERTTISKTTAFRLLQELTEFGYVSHHEKGYQLGMAAFRMGMVAKAQMRLDDVLTDLLQSLSQETGETIITAALDRDQIIYLHVIESLNPLRFVAGAGARRALPFGATGMALLSQLDIDIQKSLLNPPFPRFTDKTLTELSPYLARLQQVKRDNLVVERGEYYDGIMAVAIPVAGKTPLTFTVVGPEKRILPIQSLIVDLLQSAAAEFGRMYIEIPMLNL